MNVGVSGQSVMFFTFFFCVCHTQPHNGGGEVALVFVDRF